MGLTMPSCVIEHHRRTETSSSNLLNWLNLLALIDIQLKPDSLSARGRTLPLVFGDGGEVPDYQWRKLMLCPLPAGLEVAKAQKSILM